MDGISLGLDSTVVVLVLVAVVAIVFLAQGLRIVQQSQAMVIERLGSFHKVLRPGVNLVIPFIDKPRSLKTQRYLSGQSVPVIVEETRIDLRETVVDFPSQAMVTNDNVTIGVNGAIYYQIVDPELAVYRAENVAMAMEVLTKTSLRSLVGQSELDKIFSSREEINSALAQIMDEAGDKWGIKVTRVEIQDIVIPNEVESAMRAVMTAERNRRATVTEASGHREAAIAVAQGDKEAAVLRAEGDREAAIARAEGERQAIEKIVSAGNGALTAEQALGYLVALEYMRTLPDIAKEGDRVFLPYEASHLLSSLGGIGELLGKVSGGAGGAGAGPWGAAPRG